VGRLGYYFLKLNFGNANNLKCKTQGKENLSNLVCDIGHNQNKKVSYYAQVYWILRNQIKLHKSI